MKFNLKCPLFWGHFCCFIKNIIYLLYVNLVDSKNPNKNSLKHHQIKFDDGSAVELKINKTGRSRKIRMRYIDNQILVSCPVICPDNVAIDFANRNKDWLLKQIKRQAPKKPFEIGADIPIFGRKTILQIAKPRTKSELIKVNNQQILIVPSMPENFKEKTKSALRRLASEAIDLQIKILTPQLKKHPTKIKVTDTKSRWGSCNSRGEISLSFRLIMAPFDVLNYVIIHELAHLEHMNHSHEFWQEVERLMPHYKNSRLWLKENGHILHAIG